MKRLVVLGAVLTLLCAAAGAAASPSVKQIAAARERVASQNAERLLSRIQLPAGARVSTIVPSLLRRSEIGGSEDTELAVRHRFWKLRMPFATVESFVTQHPLPGYENDSSGGGFFDFYQQPSHGWPMQRMYSIGIARAHGWTIVRVDAGAAWVYPRSPLEVVPSSVREIDIHAANVDRVVTDAGNVAQIIRWFDRLNVAPRGSGTCKGIFVVVPVTFTFRSADHVRRAGAVVPAAGGSGCVPIQFAIGGKAQTPLIDSRAGSRGRYTFIGRVQRLLGFCVDAATRTCAAGQSTTRLSVKEIAARRKHAATLAARRLLRTFVPPPGAQRVGEGPHAHYLHAFGGPGAEYVDLHRYWVLHDSASSVMSFEKAHVPPGFGVGGGSRNADGSLLQVRFESPPRGLATRTLAVSVAQRPTRTIIRVDAQVVWVYPRSPREVVPAGVREVDVRAPNVTRHVTDPAKVGRIVRWFNRLPITPPGVSVFCGVFLYTPVTLVFRSASGAPVARAQVPAPRAWICDTIDFTIHGNRQTPLIDHSRGVSFAGRLQHLLGVRFKTSR